MNNGLKPRLAKPGDASAIRVSVREAYGMYVPRMDKEPAPMLADYGALVAQGLVHCIERADRVIGASKDWLCVSLGARSGGHKFTHRHWIFEFV